MTFSIEMVQLDNWSSRELIEYLQDKGYDTDQYFLKIHKSPHSPHDLYLEVWTDNLAIV